MSYRAVKRSSAWLAGIVLALGVPAFADPSPTGGTPKLLWTSQRQAVLNRMRQESHPIWRALKSDADRSGTSDPSYGDWGQWATVAYQVTGDPLYVQKAWAQIEPYLRTDTPPEDRNFTREYFARFVWMYDWLRPALSPDQRTQYLNTLNYWADLVTTQIAEVKLDGPWGTRTRDSDETTGHYFGLAFLALATKGENPRAEEFLGLSRVGGLSATGADRKTMRNAIKDFVEKSEGGVWVESSWYNLGTPQLLLMGVDGVLTATGTDYFPEVTRLIPQLAVAQMHELSADLKQAYQWGDDEGPRSLRLSRRISLLAMLSGLLQNDPTLGPRIHQFMEDLPDQELRMPATVFYNPYAAKAGWRAGQAKGHYASGQGLLYVHDVWDSTGSFFGAHMPNPLNVDHHIDFATDLQLYRRGEWALTHPIGYNAREGEHVNSMLIAGLSVMQEARGAMTYELGETYAYFVGATGGNRYTNGYWKPPPRFLHEWTRSVVYLPSGDRRSDTILLYDRVNAENPKNLSSLDLYKSADKARIQNAPALKQWILHMPVSPTLTSDTISWQTANGQRVWVNTLLPTDQERAVYDEKTLGLSGEIKDSEKKFQVRIRPSVERQWDTFLNVIHASGGDVAWRNSLILSAAQEAEGVLIEREGHRDILVMFNATQSPNLPPTKTDGYYLVTDPELLKKIAQARLLQTGYEVSWVSWSTPTAVFLCDLDPTKGWFAKIDDGSSVALVVNSQGVARLDVSGSGSHTLRLGTEAELSAEEEPPIANTAPTLNPIGSKTVAEGAQLTFTVSASDPDGDLLTFAAGPLPAGATFTGKTFTWTPTFGQAGTYTVTFSVSDGSLSDKETVTITVTDTPSTVTVFSDSFEVSTWNGLWTEDSQDDWFRSTERKVDGSYSAKVDGYADNAKLVSKHIDLKGRTNAKVTFSWFIESSFDTGEYLAFDVSTDGGTTWVEKAKLRGSVDRENTWHQVGVSLTNLSRLRIRFRARASSSYEDGNVDRVAVIAQ